MKRTQCVAGLFLWFEGATIQTQNEATDCFVRGAVNHSAGAVHSEKEAVAVSHVICHVIFPYQSNLRSSGFMVGVGYVPALQCQADITSMKHVPALQCQAAITTYRCQHLAFLGDASVKFIALSLVKFHLSI